MPSFRRRIRYSILGTLVLFYAVFSLVLYLALSAVLHRHVDQDLLALARAETARMDIRTEAPINPASPPGAVFRQRSDHDPDDDDDGDDEDEGPVDDDVLEEAARSLILLYPDGRLLWAGPAAVLRDPLHADQLAILHRGEPLLETLPDPGGAAVRRLSFPIVGGAETQLVLQIDRSLGFVSDSLWSLAVILCVLGLVMFGLAAAASAWLARQALSPVDGLSRTAQRISAKSLDTRASLDAPYDEFQRLASTFNAMLDRLQHVFEAQRRFIADAAHELRTPLTVIKGHLELGLEKARSPQECRDIMLGNLGQVERLITLTRSLLTLAQFAGDRPPVVLGRVQLSPLVAELVEEVRPLAADAGVDLVLESDPEPPDVRGDAQRLRQLLLNVLDNALRHAGRGGAVTIRLERREELILLSVRDTGPGIAPEHLPHLFDPFYRAESARGRELGGTGLGLAIAKEIAEAHHGRLSVESQPGTGTVFSLSLPALDPSGNGPLAPASPEPKSPEG